MSYEHQVSALEYMLAWMHCRDKSAELSANSSLLPSYHRRRDGSRLPLRYIMKNINFEFKSKRQAEDFFRRYEGRSDIGADIYGKMVEISSIAVLRDTEFITGLFKNLMEVRGWQVCGPRCTESVPHSEDNLVMLYSPVTNTWRCYQRGCGKTVPISETNLLSFREVQALFKQAHVHNAQEAGMKPASVPVLRRQQFIQQSAAMAIGSQVHDEIVYPPNFIVGRETSPRESEVPRPQEDLRLYVQVPGRDQLPGSLDQGAEGVPGQYERTAPGSQQTRHW